MAKNDRLSRMKSKKITPVTGMREYLGDSSFLMTVLVMMVFVLVHRRVVGSELQHGTGGLWCYLGMPAAFCLLISAAIAYLGAKTRLLPAAAPILGLGGVAASLVMFIVIIISRMRMAGGILGMVQEVSMLAFLGIWFVCVLMLMVTGIGMKVAPGAGVAAAVVTVTALILFVVRAMYIFSSLITALSRNLLLPDGEMADNIKWVLRSVAPGSDAARGIYFDRLLDCVGIALLMLCCVPLAVRFNSFFSELAVNMKNTNDIPRRMDYRREDAEYYREDTEYDDYIGSGHAQASSRLQAEDVSAAAPEEDSTRDSTEGKPVDRPRFRRRDRNASDEESMQRNKPVLQDSEYFDDYVPGEGWDNFLQRNAVIPEEPQIDPEETQVSPEPVQPKLVKPVRTDRPVIDPRSEDLWNQYTK